MNRSVNVFVIDTQLKTHHEKLSFLDIERDARAESRMEALKAKQQRRTIPIRTQVGKKGLAWNSIPLNVREYLIKRMEADENQVYKVHALGNNKYKVILKQAHDQFVIQTKSPNQIAFEHPDMN